MNLANRVTFVRIALAPVYLVAFALGGLWGYIAALLINAAFEITDLLDGYYARRDKIVSDMGKLLDPFADSVARFTVLLSIGMAGYASLWMVALIFYRDMTVANVRMAAIKSGRVVAARASGKAKAIVQGVGTLIILIGMVVEKAFPYFDATRDFMWRGRDAHAWCVLGSHWLMGFITLVTVASAVDYLRANWDVLTKLER
ncbi:MAG: CDP-alcohol phosphatidyltransferase family protein [Planctomycetota bacterium]